MRTLLEKVERLLQGTALEPLAREVWSGIYGIARPRARQSANYDRRTVQIMARVLKSDSNCVDIGAHKGWFLRWMLELAPEGHHFAFEPIPELAHALKKRFPQVNVHETALGDSPGTQPFRQVVDRPGRSGFRVMGHVSSGARVREIRVKVQKLDDILCGSLPIAFMKVDVEGAQLQVFQGAVRTISSFRPHIVFEHGMLAREAYGTTSEMIYDFLVDRCGLKISLLADWLRSESSLTREAFARQVGYHRGSEFCFIAHP